MKYTYAYVCLRYLHLQRLAVGLAVSAAQISQGPLNQSTASNEENLQAALKQMEFYLMDICFPAAAAGAAATNQPAYYVYAVGNSKIDLFANSMLASASILSIKGLCVVRFITFLHLHK